MSRAARLTPEERAVVSALRDAGFSIRRIATNVGRSRFDVRDYLRDPQGTRMDSEECQQVLAGRLLPFLNQHRTEEYLFQHDNARIHMSRSTKAFLEGHGVQVLEWPACSPDLNPIENLWGILSRRVYANYQQYATIEELKGAVLREWSNSDCQILRHLCSSMCNCLDEVEKKRGGAINY
ncbi:hypothetical protein Q1695_007313 [Nippostrongylus brasiliensis]|nr:hypothetical protein Q1695_007313 [Nippostrongylus brasiliensis]